MKNRLTTLLLLTGLIILLQSCGSNRSKEDANLSPNAHKVVAKEVIQGERYTYVRVASEATEYWLAINKADVKEGKTYYWSVGSEMNEFTSKELKRTFRSIFFVQDFTDQPITTDKPSTGMTGGQQQMPASSMSGKQPVPQYEGIVVPKVSGGITIAELFGKKSSFEGKTVKICGQVVKYSPGIMNRNWIHIQDGTQDAGKYDLTVTTADSAKVGDVLIFTGVIALNKDIGAGYFYDVLMENATVRK
jgi:hypothetical protein